MRLIDALLASLLTNAMGIGVVLLLTQVIRHLTEVVWLPEIQGPEAAGLVAVAVFPALAGMNRQEG